MSTGGRPVVLSVAGSDSGGGAGIQADLRTFGQLGVFGTTAVTAVTAQNLDGVSQVVPVPTQAVVEQIAQVSRGYRVRAVKTGMLWSAATATAVSDALKEYGLAPLVVDPVFVATSGAALFEPAAVDAYREELLPLCTVCTPNLDEAAILLGTTIAADATHYADVARELGARFGCSVLLKGGHADGPPRDTLWHGGEIRFWKHRRVSDVRTHGTGCCLGAALVAGLAQGLPLGEAAGRAIDFVQEALASPHQLGPGVQVLGLER